MVAPVFMSSAVQRVTEMVDGARTRYEISEIKFYKANGDGTLGTVYGETDGIDTTCGLIVKGSVSGLLNTNLVVSVYQIPILGGAPGIPMLRAATGVDPAS